MPEIFLKYQCKCGRGNSVLSFNASFFRCSSFFREYLNPHVIKMNKIVNSVNTTFEWLLKALSLSRMLVEFSLKLVYSSMCGKNFQTYGVHIPRKMPWIYAFLLIPPPPPHSKVSLKFLSSHPRQREIIHSTRRHFGENLFPPTVERGGENYDLLYQNFITYEDGLDH